MKKKHLFWLLLPSYWVLTVAAIIVVALYAFHSISNLYFKTLETDIQTRALLLANQAESLVHQEDAKGIDELCKRLGQSANTRFTIIFPDGKVWGDSNKDPSVMEYHGDRPEIQQALGGVRGMHRRYSQTLNQEMMYIAAPLKDDNQAVLCAVRASLPMTAIKGELNRMTIRVITATILTGVLAMFTCIIGVRRITSPLRGMSFAARQFAEGDFNHRIPAQQSIELDELAESLNTMSIQLNHLETVRADFVANVSHELKTPITSIKGFVETLLSDDWNHDPDTLHFLEIINQQSGRMNAIIDDLLTLSRLEQKEEIVLKQPCGLADVLDNARTLCQLQAGKKNIAITVDCPADLLPTINAPLLEQAIVNLIINAVKYSEPEKTIQVLAERQTEQVMIQIKDEGFGIENKHLHRLFERFYRVDTARSRNLGGTGLGLSIVNHIVQAHNGEIRVESTLGCGSTFRIFLPDAS
ncbi:MAG: ATP-binding protein [Kiritimatiellaceae bacterium]|nr:ATP-binding protein [Kiritimatiellaceae bacterium]